MKAGRKSVDPGLREKLVERNHSLDDLFIDKKTDVQERVKKNHHHIGKWCLGQA